MRRVGGAETVQGPFCLLPDEVRRPRLHRALCLLFPATGCRTRLGLEAPGSPAAMLEAFFLLGPGSAQEELRKRALWCGAVYLWHGIVRHRAGLLDGRRRLEVLHHVLHDLFAGTRTVL